MEASFTAERIEGLFLALDGELRAMGVMGEIHVLGGAVLCLVFHARPATREIDAHFEPAQKLRQAAARIAAAQDLPEAWLNDAAKAFLSPKGDYRLFLDRPNLRVFTAQPEYLLAMKCLAFRLGVESHDEADVRFLLRYLNIERYDRAVDVIARYYPRESFPRKTLHALEEILGTA